MQKDPLYTLPVASTEIHHAYLDQSEEPNIIRYDYFDEQYKHECGIVFDRVAVAVCRAERTSQFWHIDGCYDTLVEVKESEWLKQTRAEMSEYLRGMFPMRHFMIYFDSSGSFELIAASWAVLPEKLIPVDGR